MRLLGPTLKARFFGDCLIATASALAVMVAYLVSDSFPPAPAPAPDQSAIARLDRQINGTVEINGTTKIALQRLVALGAPLQVHWPERDKSADALQNRPVSLRLCDATLDQWLRGIEFQLHDRGTHWTSSNGQLQFGEGLPWNGPVTRRVYDVRDILNEASTLSRQFPGGRFNPRGVRTSMDPRSAAEQDLVDMVRRLTGGNTWDYALSGSGPAWGHSEVIDGRMVIIQTAKAQRQIEVLLSSLRARSSPPNNSGGH